MTTTGARDQYAGPESGPEAPFPIRLQGPVIKGFGRGSKELGIPTANIPPSGLNTYPDLPNGVYFGYTSLQPPSSSQSTSTPSPTPTTPQIYPSVLSIGLNPFYANTTRSVEIHILHSFPTDFYGWSLNLLMLGYIRPEQNYDGLQALIDDIKFDCEVARRSLEREGWRVGDTDGWKGWLGGFEWAEGLSREDVERVQGEVLGGKGKGPGEAEGKL